MAIKIPNYSPIRFYKNDATDFENGSYAQITGEYLPQEFKDYARTTVFGEPQETETILRGGDIPVVEMTNGTRTLLPLNNPISATGKLIITGTGSANAQDDFFYGVEIWDGSELVERLSFTNVEQTWEIELKKTTYTLWAVCFTDPFIPSPGRTINVTVTQVTRSLDYQICGETYEATPLNVQDLDGRELKIIFLDEYEFDDDIIDAITSELIKGLFYQFDYKGEYTTTFYDDEDVEIVSYSFNSEDYATGSFVIPINAYKSSTIINGSVFIKNSFWQGELIESEYQEETPYGFAWQLSTVDHSTADGLYFIQIEDYTSEPIQIVSSTNKQLLTYKVNGWRNCLIRHYVYELYIDCKITAIPKNETALAENQNRNVVIDAFDIIARQMTIKDPIPYYLCDILEGAFNCDEVTISETIYAKLDEAEFAEIDAQSYKNDFSIQLRLASDCQDFGENEFKCNPAEYIVQDQNETEITRGTIPSGQLKIIEISNDCPPPTCDPLIIKFNDSLVQSVSEPCGQEINLTCSSTTQNAYVDDGSEVTGLYIFNSENGRYERDIDHYLFYNGTAWELEKTGSNIVADNGSEEFPWQATWSGSPSVTVTQATIQEECGGGECDPALLTLNGEEFISVDSGSTTDIEIINHNGDIVTPIEVNDSVISVNTDDWVRPDAWLPLPDVSSEDALVFLYLVFENSPNILGWWTQSGAECTIDLGDGTPPFSSATNTVEEHTYNYASIGGTVNQYYDGRNYKQVIVKFTLNSFTANRSITIGETNINTSQSVHIVDISHNISSNVQFGQRGITTKNTLSFLEKVTLNANAQVGNNAFNAPFLKKVVSNGFLTNNNIVTNIFSNSGDFKIKDINISTNASGTNTGMFSNSLVSEIGNVTATSNISNFAYNAFNLRKVGDITMIGGSSISGSFFGARNLVLIGTINVSGITSILNAFRGCVSLRKVNMINCGNITNTSSAFFNTGAIEELSMTGLTVGVDVSNNKLTATAINAFFTSLGTASGSQTINVSNCIGSATCDTTIATAKGFTVII